MKLSEKQQLFAYHIACLIHHAFDVHGIRLTFGEAHRTESQTLLNYFGFRVIKGGPLGIQLVKSKKLSQTLSSLHLDRLAVDFNFFINGELTYDYDAIKPLGDYWVSLDHKNRWGGDFNKNGVKDGFVDTPHFERQK